MPKKRQALVEFEDILGACNAVNYAADNQIYIAGHPAFVNYSTSQKISRPGDTDDSRGVNNVLLFTILNPIYSITTVGEAERVPQRVGGFGSCPGPCRSGGGGVPGGPHRPSRCLSLPPAQDVLYTICNPCGPVQRIVIFRKNGVQAMVEYPFGAAVLCSGGGEGEEGCRRADAGRSGPPGWRQLPFHSRYLLNGADVRLGAERPARQGLPQRGRHLLGLLHAQDRVRQGACAPREPSPHHHPPPGGAAADAPPPPGVSPQPTRLNVFKNDQDTWDYTNPNLSGQGNGCGSALRLPGARPPPRGPPPAPAPLCLQGGGRG